MRQAGYLEDAEEDATLFARVRDLLLKRTLMRPPLPAREDELRGEAPCGRSCSARSRPVRRSSADESAWLSLLAVAIDPSRSPRNPDPRHLHPPPTCDAKRRPHTFADPEAHLFEDAICLTFLSLEFTSFSTSYIAPTLTADDRGTAPSAEEAARQARDDCPQDVEQDGPARARRCRARTRRRTWRQGAPGRARCRGAGLRQGHVR